MSVDMGLCRFISKAGGKNVVYAKKKYSLPVGDINLALEMEILQLIQRLLV